MKRALGYIIILIAIAGITYFRRYHGALISYPWLWYLFFILLVLIGAGLVFAAMRQPAIDALSREHNHRSEIKQKGEKVRVEFDACEFGDRSFQQTVIDPQTEAVNIFVFSGFGPNPEKMEQVAQSFMTFENGDETFSGGFTVDSLTLKSYVISGRLFLYVDPSNKKNYVFDVEK